MWVRFQAEDVHEKTELGAIQREGRPEVLTVGGSGLQREGAWMQDLELISEVSGEEEIGEVLRRNGQTVQEPRSYRSPRSGAKLWFCRTGE